MGKSLYFDREVTEIKIPPIPSATKLGAGMVGVSKGEKR